ncbi:MAG: Arsenate reductase [Anaerolineae bacterium]|nr:Arsenate reductase [Anaerolineae bacterium]
MMSKHTVLILCTGNSCRSQMAEGLINAYLGDTWQAYSAGTTPSGYVHPLAIAALAELGLDISRHRPKSTAEFRGMPLDLVITVCDDAAENCPVWLGSGQKVHIGFPDPAKAGGTATEKMAIFRQVRDDIKHSVLNYLVDWHKREQS